MLAVNRNYPTFLLGLQVCNLSYSLLKFLAFSDHPDQLFLPGLWFSTVWNLLAFVFLGLLWQFVIVSPHPFPCIDLVSISTSNGSSYLPFDQSTSTTTSSEEPTSSSPLSQTTKRLTTTLHHIVRLLKYCMCYWPWISVGFTFLIIYSTGNYFINSCIVRH
jgi:hypothetical protein